MKKQMLLEQIEQLRLELLREPMKNNYHVQEHQINQVNRRLDDLIVQFVREEIPEDAFKMLSRV